MCVYNLGNLIKTLYNALLDRYEIAIYINPRRSRKDSRGHTLLLCMTLYTVWYVYMKIYTIPRDGKWWNTAIFDIVTRSLILLNVLYIHLWVLIIEGLTNQFFIILWHLKETHVKWCKRITKNQTTFSLLVFIIELKKNWTFTLLLFERF